MEKLSPIHAKQRSSNPFIVLQLNFCSDDINYASQWYLNEEITLTNINYWTTYIGKSISTLLTDTKLA